MKKLKPTSKGKVEVNLVAEEEGGASIPEIERLFRVAILGDFSARSNRGLFRKGADLAGQRLHSIDRDNFDEVIAGLGVEIHLPVAGANHPPVKTRFSELDDFHPDHLFERVNVFRSLTEMIQGLDSSPLPSGARSGVNTAEEAFEPNLSEFTQGSLLDEMIQETEKRPKLSGWDAFLQKVAEPHLVPDIDPQQKELMASVSAISSKLMAAILHFPDFQSMEAAWRGVHFLISRLEMENGIQIYLIDVSKDELAADLREAKNLRSTGSYQLLVEKAVDALGEKPWALLAGNYTFDQTLEDAELLTQLGRMARQLGAPFISAANPHLLGCESLAETPDPEQWKWKPDKKAKQAWESLRKNREAPYLGLVLPRFLLRLPYGPGTDPVNSFDFEEMASEPQHGHYLWGNPCFAGILLLSQAFLHYGWNLHPGLIQEIGDLPLHIYKKEGEPRVKPCGEVVLTERAGEMILEKGLMPLLSSQSRDILRLGRFQSLAAPPTPLAGQWK
jgi:type VI secretion system protein ImpC